MLLALGCCASLGACSASASMDEAQLQLVNDIEIARAPLRTCVDAFTDTTTGEAITARLFAEGHFDALMRDTESVVGREDPRLVALRAKPSHSSQDVGTLIYVLGALAANEGEASNEQHFLRQKAIVLAHVWFARASEGRCAPTPQLLTLIAKIPNADR